MRLQYFFWDEKSRRVCGFGIIDSELWEMHRTHLATRGLTMAPCFDDTLPEKLRTMGPHNYTVTEDGRIVELPPEQQNLTPEVIVVTDDQLGLLNQKMDRLIQLMTDLPDRMSEATEKAMRRAMDGH